MLAVLALDLVGRFIFLGVLVTILAYLLLMFFILQKLVMHPAKLEWYLCQVRKKERELRRERERELGKEHREQERKHRERARLKRWIQFTQLLEAPPEGCLLTFLSSFIFVMLAILALELVGWFIYLCLLITIVVYLLLIISFHTPVRSTQRIVYQRHNTRGTTTS
ncbi:hypothetical protein DFH08DRAFT_1080344 [Mycena albidolilacea]|uniref:Uncharacterized protein n=1 Tax=Mycena albidolilacea TaxID=1033008 RepID=A0AAD7A0X5_9AGAR|nr:hypothetical protein DFH08DRAFT_1080344 [Mycena albidolilacea]